MPLIIKNGILVTNERTFQSDILIENETIRQIGQNLDVPGAQVVDASDRIVMPGGVDPHTHFDLPMAGTISSDDHYTGTRAAAFGGTTTVLDFVPLESRPGNRKDGVLRSSVEAWSRKAEMAAVDYSFHMNLTCLDGEIEKEITDLPAMGVTTLKVFLAYNGRLRLSDGEIFRALRIARENGMLVMAHCENGDVIEQLVEDAVRKGHTAPEWHARTRPAWGAVEASLRACALAAQADASIYIVHVNTVGEVEMLRYARRQGLKVMGETCPQYLSFTADLLQQADGAKWVCSPPLRTLDDQRGLWEGLSDGTLQAIGTDHCPFYLDGSKPIIFEGKEIAIPGKELGRDDFRKIPNGLPGVGDRLPVTWTSGVESARITAQQFVALNSTNPARIFGLYPRKGALLPGSDADLVIWDPRKEITYGVKYARHRTDHNLYEGWKLTGMPEKVFLRGQLIVEKGEWHGRVGMGQYLYRRAGAPVL